MEGGVYKRAVFKRGNSVKYFTSVRSADIILWWWWFEGGGGASHKIFTNREGTNNFSAASKGDQKFIRVFHPVSTTPPPRELKNDNSLSQFLPDLSLIILISRDHGCEF